MIWQSVEAAGSCYGVQYANIYQVKGSHLGEGGRFVYHVKPAALHRQGREGAHCHEVKVEIAQVQWR